MTIVKVTTFSASGTLVKSCKFQNSRKKGNKFTFRHFGWNCCRIVVLCIHS